MNEDTTTKVLTNAAVILTVVGFVAGTITGFAFSKNRMMKGEPKLWLSRDSAVQLLNDDEDYVVYNTPRGRFTLQIPPE